MINPFRAYSDWSWARKTAGYDLRSALSARYIRGRGIEIGALHHPLWVPKPNHVIYVDRLTVEQLRLEYHQLDHLSFTQVDVIDDGERLANFGPGSVDFIIANHFLEHAQDPIGTIARHLEVLRTGGILFLAVPDKRFTFDRNRPETPFEHLLRDHLEGPAWSYAEHMREYVTLVLNPDEDAIEATIEDLTAKNYSIHFHVWADASLREFFRHLVEQLRFPMKIEQFVNNTEVWGENVCVLRKTRG